MKTLTPVELEVMNILWKQGTLKPAEIQTFIKRPLSNAALRSVLKILLEKEHVSRTKKGKAFFYTSITKRNTIFENMVHQIIHYFSNHSTGILVAQLIDMEDLSKKDICFLKEILDKKIND